MLLPFSLSMTGRRFSRTVRIYNCHPSVTMSRDYFHSQKCLAHNKPHGHSNDRALDRKPLDTPYPVRNSFELESQCII